MKARFDFTANVRRPRSTREEKLALSGVCEVRRRSAGRILNFFMSYATYILNCTDGPYYTGLTKDLEARMREHEIGVHTESYTFSRRPVKLVWSIVTETYQEAVQWERQIKGWSLAKKEALIRGDIDGIHKIVKLERIKRDRNKKGDSH